MSKRKNVTSKAPAKNEISAREELEAKKALRIAEMRSEVESLYSQLEIRAKEAEISFKEAIVSDGYSVEGIAQRLSKKFPTLRFTVSFENGTGAIKAAPWCKAPIIKEGNNTYYYEDLLLRWKNAVNDKSYYPDFSTVSLYAQGLRDGIADSMGGGHRLPFRYMMETFPFCR